MKQQPRPYLVLHPIRGGTRYLKFVTRDKAIEYYSDIIKAHKRREISTTRGNPQMFKITKPTRLELGLLSL